MRAWRRERGQDTLAPRARRRCRAHSYADLASSQETRLSAIGKAEHLPSNPPPSLASRPPGGKASCLPWRRQAPSGQHQPQQKESTPVGVLGRQDALAPRGPSPPRGHADPTASVGVPFGAGKAECLPSNPPPCLRRGPRREGVPPSRVSPSETHAPPTRRPRLGQVPGMATATARPNPARRAGRHVFPPTSSARKTELAQWFSLRPRAISHLPSFHPVGIGLASAVRSPTGW